MDQQDLVGSAVESLQSSVTGHKEGPSEGSKQDDATSDVQQLRGQENSTAQKESSLSDKPSSSAHHEGDILPDDDDPNGKQGRREEPDREDSDGEAPSSFSIPIYDWSSLARDFEIAMAEQKVAEQRIDAEYQQLLQVRSLFLRPQPELSCSHPRS